MPPNPPNAPQNPITLEDLEIPSSGNFHHLDDALVNQEVGDAFDKILKGSAATEDCRQVRAKRTVDGVDVWASFLLFHSEPTPHFLPKSQFKEKIYGFTLLIEAEIAGTWIIGIFKKGATGINEGLEDVLKMPSRRAFSRAFGKGATYQKLSLKRMTASKHELLASSYEANDLKTALPTLGVTRSVPRSLRMRHEKYGSISITPGTFRLQKSGGRCGIDDLAELVILVAKEIKQSNRNEFLDVLPQEVDFSQKPKSLRPTGVLIELGALLEAEDVEVWRTNKKGAERKVSSKLLLRALGGALETSKKGTDWELEDEDGNLAGSITESATGYRLTRLLHPSAEVRKAAENGIEKCRLATWVNRNEQFRVIFSDPDFFFSGGQLYRRTGIDSDLALVQRAIIAWPALNQADSEKGKSLPKTVADTEFPVNSIFRIVENALLPNSDYLWCSDLGDEWADYICLQGNQIIFAHCKHGKKTTLGASDFQEVLGQAVKNLGNVKSTPEEFCRKIRKAKDTATWGSTGITRLRTQQKTWANFETDLVARIGSPNFNREVHLVVTMLSKAQFDAEANKADKSKRKASFNQLVWLLSSFINSCRELGATPKIFCKD